MNCFLCGYILKDGVISLNVPHILLYVACHTIYIRIGRKLGRLDRMVLIIWLILLGTAALIRRMINLMLKIGIWDYFCSEN